MRRNKGIRLIAVIIPILIIAIIGVFVALYFLTDMFKSKKELFASKLMNFISQEEAKDEMASTDIMSYFTKKQNTPYTNYGEFYASINDSEAQESLELTNNTKITFEGKTNSKQKLAEQNINIEYSNDVKFPISYKQDGDIIGLQTDYVSQKYVSVNLKGIEDSENDIRALHLEEISELIPFNSDNIESTWENLQDEKFKDKFTPVLDLIKEDDISIIETLTGKEYTLSLDTEKIRSMVIKFLEIVQNDNEVLDLINQNLKDDEQITSSKVQELIQKVQEQEIENEEIKIILTTVNDKTTKIEIKTATNSLGFEKVESSDEKQYIISLIADAEESTINVAVKAEFKGLTSNNVSENYSLSLRLSEDESYEYVFKNTVKFDENLVIDELSQDDTLLLTDLENEQLQMLIQLITQRIVEVNNDQMKELGLAEGTNPLALYMYPVLKFTILNTAKNTIETSDMEENVNAVFNNKFLKYEGEIKGTMVKSLLQEVTTSNNSSSNYVEIEGVITEISSIYDIENSKTYKVTLEYDEEGRVNKIIVEEV